MSRGDAAVTARILLVGRGENGVARDGEPDGPPIHAHKCQERISPMPQSQHGRAVATPRRKAGYSVDRCRADRRSQIFRRTLAASPPVATWIVREQATIPRSATGSRGTGTRRIARAPERATKTPACSEPRPASFIHSTQAYYSNDEQVLDSLVYATPGFAVNLDAKLAALAVQKGGAKKKFVVAALGSSVTAGHDGFGDTAWPAVLQRRLAKALAPFGIEVEVRNQAVGGSEPFPRSLCMSTLAGDDADLVIREWERARGAGQTGRGGDAETTRTVRGDGSRRRRGRHVDSPRRRVAAPPRLPRG